MAETRQARCPICDRETDLASPPLGTFCSERCKLVDLGKWFGEEYCVSEPLRPDHFAEAEGADDLEQY